MVKSNTIKKKERPQIVAFSWGHDQSDKVVPWVNVNGEWVARAGLSVDEPVLGSLADYILSIRESSESNEANLTFE